MSCKSRAGIRLDFKRAKPLLHSMKLTTSCVIGLSAEKELDPGKYNFSLIEP